MKHEQIDSRARGWIVTRGRNGRLEEEFDPGLLAKPNPGYSAAEIAEVLFAAAGETEVAENRLW